MDDDLGVQITSSKRDGADSEMFVKFSAWNGGEITISVWGCCGGGCYVENSFNEEELIAAIKEAKYRMKPYDRS